MKGRVSQKQAREQKKLEQNAAKVAKRKQRAKAEGK